MLSAQRSCAGLQLVDPDIRQHHISSEPGQASCYRLPDACWVTCSRDQCSLLVHVEHQFTSAYVTRGGY
jgi:hypothetical protein